MSLPGKLKPFHGQHVVYNVPPNSRQLVGALGLEAPDGKLRLYIFDWTQVDDDTKDAIREKSGQDDYVIFAVINGEGANLEALLASKHQGFLMYAADRPKTIFLGDGAMETFTTKVDTFTEKLTT